MAALRSMPKPASQNEIPMPKEGSAHNLLAPQ